MLSCMLLDVGQVTPKHESCHHVVLCLEIWAVSNQFDVVSGKHYADIYDRIHIPFVVNERGRRSGSCFGFPESHPKTLYTNERR